MPELDWNFKFTFYPRFPHQWRNFVQKKKKIPLDKIFVVKIISDPTDDRNQYPPYPAAGGPGYPQQMPGYPQQMPGYPPQGGYGGKFIFKKKERLNFRFFFLRN